MAASVSFEGVPYQRNYAEKVCGHSSLFILSHRDQAEIGFCGLCWLGVAWEAEFPGRFHEYKLLAENGNPEVSPAFWSHLKANLGLIPPQSGQSLKDYRYARKRLYGEPSKRQFPVAAALYTVMGFQPKLAVPLLRVLCGFTLTDVKTETGMSTWGVNQSLAKGIRYVMREIVQ